MQYTIHKNSGDVSFVGADLKEADLTGADLKGADLTGADHPTDLQISLWTYYMQKTLYPLKGE